MSLEYLCISNIDLKSFFTHLCFTDESMGEEDDSDLETRVADRASGQPVVNSSVQMLDSDVSQRPQLNTGQSPHLDNVNFTWLQDYFSSSWAIGLPVIFVPVNQIIECLNVQFELL